MSIMRPLFLFSVLSSSAFAQSGNLGIFTNSGDVGSPAIKGSSEFSNGQYQITGSGANIWAKQDQFQYVWREMTGNFTVKATMRFLGQGNEHRKAGIMVRQSLDSDAIYADVVIRQRHARASVAQQTGRRHQHVRSPVRRSGQLQGETGPYRRQDLHVHRQRWC